jgi:uncharacterized protein (DUF952 family)
MLITHITTRTAWEQAQHAGEYRAPSLAEVGFIHFSRLEQVLGVANAFYRGQTDLVLLAVDKSRLKAELKDEPPVHPGPSDAAPDPENLFPHLYGPLNLDAVAVVYDFPPEADGSFKIPPAILRDIDEGMRR